MALTAKEEVFKSIVKFVTHWFLNSDGVDKEPNYEKWLAEQVNKKPAKKKVEDTEYLEEYKRFKEAYPASNKFTYLDKEFDPVKMGDKKRGLRGDDSKCLKKFQQLIRNTGEKPEVYIKALQIEVETLKQKSYRTGNNHLSYMPAMEVWLNNSKYYNTYVGESMPEPIGRKQEAVHSFNG